MTPARPPAAPSPPSAPRPGGAVLRWCLYDFANSAFTTVIVTFVYATFFTQSIAQDESRGFGMWTLGVAVTGIVVAVVSPFLGAMADRGALRRPFLVGTTLVAVVGTALLYLPEPGQAGLAIVLFVIANVAFEMANVFYNAYLPDIAPPNRIGRVSGLGWSLGYVGGLLAMVAALVLLVRPSPPLFGLDEASAQPIRATALLVAVWYGLFSLPLLLRTPPARVAASARGGALLRGAWSQLRATFRQVRRYRQVVRLLVARLFYNDGLVTVFALGGIYAAHRFAFTTERLIAFGLFMNVTAGAGALAFGFLDDRLGGKPTVLVSLGALMVTTAGALLAPNEATFWLATGLLGLFLGPNQSASRSLMGRFVPPAMQTEFFGFFAFSGKATTFLGPLLVGRVVEHLDARGVAASWSWGLATVLVFFAVGGIVLLGVDEAEGVARAREPVATDPGV